MQEGMQDFFSEKSNGITEGVGAIVQPPNNTPEAEPMSPSDNPLQDYVLKVMMENNLTYPGVARMAKRRGGTIGKTTVQQIASGKTDSPGIYTLVELAWGLGRPIDEVVGAALGVPVSESGHFKKSDFANLFDLFQQLPGGDQRAMKRYLQMMEREMRRVLMQPDDADLLLAEK